MDRYKALLDDYYGVGKKEGSKSNNDIVLDSMTDINSEKFSAKVYVQNKLLDNSFLLCLKEHNKLIEEVKALDSDVQLLVYDNYAKFIDATDTVSSMKDRVSEIEGELQGLISKMDSISEFASALTQNNAFSQQKDKIERLTRLQALVSSLAFLFEIPQKLRESIKASKYRRCVDYYFTATSFLAKYKDVPSFATISRESDDIMRDLRGKLDSDLNAILETSSLSLYASEFHQKLEVLSRLERTEDFSSMFVQGYGKEFKARLNEIEESSETAEALLHSAANSVLTMLKNACTSYKELFLFDTPNETSLTSLQRTKKLTRLSEFVKDNMNEFFGALKRKFLNRFSESSKVAKETNDPNAEAFEKAIDALNTFLHLLSSFDFENDVIQGSDINDRRTEIVELVTRQYVVSEFEKLKHRIILSISQRSQEFMIGSNIQEIGSSLAKRVCSDIDTSLEALNVIITSNSSILNELAAIFQDLVAFQHEDLYYWLAYSLTYGCDEDCNQSCTVSLNESEKYAHAHYESAFHTRNRFFVLALAYVSQDFAEYVKQRRMPEKVVHAFKKSMNIAIIRFIDITGKKHMKNLCKVLTSLKECPENIQVSLAIKEFGYDMVNDYCELCEYLGEYDIIRNMKNEQERLGVEGIGRFQDLGSRKIISESGRLKSDIDRLFESKIILYQDLKLNIKDIIRALISVILKGLFEEIRMSTIATKTCKQLVIDLTFVEVTTITLFGVSDLGSLFAQIVKLVSTRCLITPTISHGEMSEICKAAAMELSNLQIISQIGHSSG